MKLRHNQFTLSGGEIIDETPILFKTEMVKAILEGRKTQTRLTKGLEIINRSNENIDAFYGAIEVKGSQQTHGFIVDFEKPKEEDLFLKFPYGTLGDLLWVRETMILNKNSNTYWPKADRYYHSGADHENTVPSIHMPKSAARIWLMIEDIRVERLYDITKEDALAEGVEGEDGIYRNYLVGSNQYLSPENSFFTLFESINGKGNPWLWVITFRVLSTTGRPSLSFIEENFRDLTPSLNPSTL
jgi:hypothetical protein